MIERDNHYTGLVEYFARLYGATTELADYANEQSLERRPPTLTGTLLAGIGAKREAQDWSDVAHQHRVDGGKILEEAASAGVDEAHVTQMATAMAIERGQLARLLASELRSARRS